MRADKGMTWDCLCLFKSLLKNLRGDSDNCLFNIKRLIINMSITGTIVVWIKALALQTV